MSHYLTPAEADELYRLPNGRSQRLAKRGAIPALIFPDGTIRFDANELDAHLRAAGYVSVTNTPMLKP